MFPISGTGGKIVKTTNAGATWVEQTTAPFTGSWADFVHFFNANDGVCVGDPVSSGGDFVIYTTTNGGNTWTQVPGANIPNVTGTEAGIVDYYDAVGDIIWFGTGIGRIYKSTDKGLNWTVVQTNVGANQAYPVFKDANTGLMILAASPYTIKKTIDGGATWNTLTPTGYFLKFPHICNVPGTPSMWVDVSSGPGTGSSYSMDDCSSFLDIDTSSNTQYTSVKFYDINTGWAGGFNASSTDGGIYMWDPSVITVGLNEQKPIKYEQINVYPNPTSDFVNIEFSGIKTDKAVISVYNLIGEKISTKDFYPMFNDLVQVDLSGNTAGIYLVTVNTGNSLITKRVSLIR